jgi:hypothetical protein
MCIIGFKTHNPEIPALAYRQFNTDFPLVFLDFQKTRRALIGGEQAFSAGKSQ